MRFCEFFNKRYMQIVYTSGNASEWLGINGIKESDMTDEQRKEYLDLILKTLSKIDSNWFNKILKLIVTEYGYKSTSTNPYEYCGDFSTTFSLPL